MDEALYRNWFQWAQERLGPDTEAADRAACAAVAAMTAGLAFTAAARAARNAASRKGQPTTDDNRGYPERLERMHKRLAPVYALDREAAEWNHVGRLYVPTQRVMVLRQLIFAWGACSTMVIVGLAIIVDARGNPVGAVLGGSLLLLSVLPAYLSRAHLADLRTSAVDSMSGGVLKEIKENAEDDRYYLTVAGKRFQVGRNVFESVRDGEATTIFFSRHGATFLNLEVYEAP
jgi:hypothetical protein